MRKSNDLKSKMNPDQRRFLLAELSRFESAHRYTGKERKLPMRLAKAQREITAFHERERRSVDQQRKRFSQEVARVRQEIYFGTPESALTALTALKRAKP